MKAFDDILNWKLKRGSHRFPGKDGGTCINEAALVAAGFAYKPISVAEDMPECFSRPICGLAMLLNDLANDEQRQRLLPYVTRLACADTRKVERARAAYIRKRMDHWISFAGAQRLPNLVVLSFDTGLQVLEGALAIGRQADPLGPDEVQTRMEAAQAGKRVLPRVEEPTSASGKPFFSKVKSWLTLKETEPAA